jgi:excisionase family DNA binding protein
MIARAPGRTSDDEIRPSQIAWSDAMARVAAGLHGGYGHAMDDELMTVAEIAAILKLNPQTIRNWIDAGTLPHLRLGQRRVRVYRSDFNQLIENAAARRQTGAAFTPPGGIWDGDIPPPIAPGV